MSLASKWQNWGSHQLCLGPTWFLFLPWAPQTTGTGYPLGLWFNWCTTQGWGRRQLSCRVHYAWLQASSSAIFFSSTLAPSFSKDAGVTCCLGPSMMGKWPGKSSVNFHISVNLWLSHDLFTFEKSEIIALDFFKMQGIIKERNMIYWSWMGNPRQK